MKIIVFMLLLLCASTARADSVCEGFAELGREVMRIRQEGVPRWQCEEIVGTDMKAGVEMVKLAYATPKYETERRKNAAVASFEEKILEQCLKTRKNK
jgi:hypothetical protein